MLTMDLMNLHSGRSLFRDLGFRYFYQSFAILCGHEVLRREDLSLDDWLDPVVDVVGVRLNTYRFMLYSLFCYNDIFVFDGCERSISQPVEQ